MNKKSLKKWFIAQIKPNSYELAIRNLERQGFETFLPKMEKTQRLNNRFFVKKTYVFPGYIFICFNPHIVNWSKINSTYGVSKILAFNKKPCEISSDLILGLKNRYEINSYNTQNEKLKKGDSIKFQSGPFVELIVKVESVDEKNRIWILLEAMGGFRKLKLEEKNMYVKV